MQIPDLAAAREVASSPSGCASWCEAVGLKPKGRVTYPNNRDEPVLPNLSLCIIMTNLRAEDLGACVDFLDIDQNPRSNSVPIVGGFVFAQTDS